jgi:hypothetical protein
VWVGTPSQRNPPQLLAGAAFYKNCIRTWMAVI